MDDSSTGMQTGGVLCSGNIVFDILARPVAATRWGVAERVDTIEHHMGGNGASTAYALGTLGALVRLVGMVGPDPFGDLLIDKLRGASVDVTPVSRSRAPTPVTIALVHASGERLLLHSFGSSKEAFAAPIDFTPELTRGIAHYHLGSAFSLPRIRATAEETLRRARAAGLTTSLDTTWDAQGRWLEDLAPWLPHLDILFVNQEEARMLSGERALLSGGARMVVVKLGAGGCRVLTSGGEFHSPAFDVEVVDTTGAGDCFVGGFLAARQRGLPLEECARIANAVAAFSIRELGGCEGVRSWAETCRAMICWRPKGVSQ